MSPLVALWKEDLLGQGKKKAAEALADPAEYENLFPDLKFALQAEERYKVVRERGNPSTDYMKLKDSLDWDLIQMVKDNPVEANGGPSKPPPAALLDMEDDDEEPFEEPVEEEEQQAKVASPTSAGTSSSGHKVNGDQVG